jgi:transcriptional regulator with XRE-family HTH domain
MRERINLSSVAKYVLSQHGLTTKALGERIGLSQASVSRLAAGKQNSIGHEAALALLHLAGAEVRLPDLTRPEAVACAEARDAA